MGSWSFGQYDTPQKAELLNWLASGTHYQTVQTAGTYSLQPMETSPARLQALKIQRGTGNNAWLWVEYRQPVGNYGSTLPSEVFSGALIHYEDSLTGIHTHLLDFTAGDGNWTNVALAPGQTWQDPYTNVSLTVQSATASALTLNVSYGTAPCTHASPTVTLSPVNPTVYLGASAIYTVSIRNNDAPGCSTGTFTLASGQPAGWPFAFSESTITVSPGQSLSATLTETVTATTTPRTYPVSVTATSGTYAGTGAANCTAVAPLPLSTALSVAGLDFYGSSDRTGQGYSS